MTEINNLQLKEFIDKTNSKEPVPGGGGIAAAVGSLGAALSGMVCHLTTGKKKYAEYEEDIQKILKKSTELSEKLFFEINEDAKNFSKLMECFSLPKETEKEKNKRQEKVQNGLKLSAKAPIEIVKLSYETILLLDELSKKGSKMAISDVGCAAAASKASLNMAWLNVKVNLKSIKDTNFNENVEKELIPIIKKGNEISDNVYNNVLKELV